MIKIARYKEIKKRVTCGHHRVHVEGKNRLISGNGGRIMDRWPSPSLILNRYAVKPGNCARKAQRLVEEAARLLAKSSALEKQVCEHDVDRSRSPRLGRHVHRFPQKHKTKSKDAENPESFKPG
jgi:hypothetical protein